MLPAMTFPRVPVGFCPPRAIEFCFRKSAIWALVFAGCLEVVLTSTSFATPVPRTKDASEYGLLVQLDVTDSDLVAAVTEVAEDQIVHGTYSYEKERILYGAHRADAAQPFAAWTGPGKVIYKVAEKVLAPRYFRDSGDIGTIAVRYVIESVSPTSTTLRIDAVFLDARRIRHVSDGTVEASEYAAIQNHVRNLQAERKQTEQAVQQVAADRARSDALKAATPASAANAQARPSSYSGQSAQQLQSRVDTLRHQVELRVKDSGAALKSAPFRSAATLVSVPGGSEVVIEVLSPYWYGVETTDGHRGWIHHSQLEALP